MRFRKMSTIIHFSAEFDRLLSGMASTIPFGVQVLEPNLTRMAILDYKSIFASCHCEGKWLSGAKHGFSTYRCGYCKGRHTHAKVK